MSQARYRLSMVRPTLLLLLAVFLATGCATSTIESRMREKAASFAAMPPEVQKLVETGQIRRGMSEDAVYIAWGKPGQIVQQEDERGMVEFWLYQGGWLEETRYWPRYSRVPVTDYQPRAYVSAEVTFVKGIVDSWRTLPQPVY